MKNIQYTLRKVRLGNINFFAGNISDFLNKNLPRSSSHELYGVIMNEFPHTDWKEIGERIVDVHR